MPRGKSMLQLPPAALKQARSPRLWQGGCPRVLDALAFGPLLSHASPPAHALGTVLARPLPVLQLISGLKAAGYSPASIHARPPVVTLILHAAMISRMARLNGVSCFPTPPWSRTEIKAASKSNSPAEARARSVCA